MSNKNKENRKKSSSDSYDIFDASMGYYSTELGYENARSAVTEIVQGRKHRGYAINTSTKVIEIDKNPNTIQIEENLPDQIIFIDLT